MELNEKLQQLRKQRGLTQEQLARELYVSRTAISKWESGRGYPSIDSLKAIARFFSVSVDELLSGNEALAVAREDHRAKDGRFRRVAFALMDISVLLFLVLPFFGQATASGAEVVTLLALTGAAPYLRALYLALVLGQGAWGALCLVLCRLADDAWPKGRVWVSLMLNGAGALVMVISRQPYGATILLIYLLMKLLMMAKRP